MQLPTGDRFDYGLPGYLEAGVVNLLNALNVPNVSADGTGLVSGDGTRPPIPFLIYQSAVPVGIAQSGTVATAGTITFAIALPRAYSGIWLYFPANAVTNNSGNPGYYWCTSVVSSTTNFQVTSAYLANMTLPIVPTGFVNAVGSNSAYTGSTAEITLGSVTILGGTMGANGMIHSIPSYRANSGTGTKTLLTRFGGTAFTGRNTITATYTSVDAASMIANCGVENLQVSPGSSGWAPYPVLASASTSLYGSVNSALDQELKFTGQSINAADYVILESAFAMIYPKS